MKTHAARTHAGLIGLDRLGGRWIASPWIESLSWRGPLLIPLVGWWHAWLRSGWAVRCFPWRWPFRRGREPSSGHAPRAWWVQWRPDLHSQTGASVGRWCKATSSPCKCVWSTRKPDCEVKWHSARATPPDRSQGSGKASFVVAARSRSSTWMEHHDCYLWEVQAPGCRSKRKRHLSKQTDSPAALRQSRQESHSDQHLGRTVPFHPGLLPRASQRASKECDRFCSWAREAVPARSSSTWCAKVRKKRVVAASA